MSRRAARRLIVLHPKQNTESEQKWQTSDFVHQNAWKCNSVKMLLIR